MTTRGLDVARAQVSGYRQVQVFYELGWIGKDWFKGACALSWMVDDCEINYGLRGGAARKWRPKSGTHEMRLKLRRLSRFVSDVERCGFFDDHLWPMTHYFASLAAAKVDPAAVGLMYTDKLESELPRAVWGETGGRRRSVSHSMVTGGSSWSKVLVSTAHNRSDANHDLALEVTQRICALD